MNRKNMNLRWRGCGKHGGRDGNAEMRSADQRKKNIANDAKPLRRYYNRLPDNMRQALLLQRALNRSPDFENGDVLPARIRVPGERDDPLA